MPRRSAKFSQKALLPRDIHGWIDAITYKPEKKLYFELLMLKDDEGRTKQGWWTGQEWEFHPETISKKVMKWRFLESEERCMND